MLFSELSGQSEVKKRLIQSVKEARISHAQLFAGEDGFGTLPLALSFAQYILCEDKQENDACGKCSACVKVQKLIHPDLHLVFPVTTTAGNLKPISDDFIGEWREAVLEDPYLNATEWYRLLGQENKQGMIYKHESDEIIRKLSLKTFEADYKIMIIWQADRMNMSCANKLLKILEEPPPQTLFIFISAFPDLLLPTILSRLQTIRIPALKEEDIMFFLNSKLDISEKDAKSLSALSGGSISRALEYFRSSDEQSENLELFIKWMRLCYKKDVVEINDWVDNLAATGREKIKQFLLYSIAMLRENFLLNEMPEHKDVLVRMGDKESEFSKNFSRFIKQNNIFPLSEELNKAIRDIEANAYQKTVLLDLSLKTMRMIT